MKTKPIIYKSKKNSIKAAVLLVFSLSSLVSLAQDKLLKRDSTKLEVKVLEITPTEIKYKLFTYQDGPTISVLKNDVAEIVYKNGQRELFTITNTSSQASKEANPVPNQGIYKIGMFGVRHYTENKVLIDEREFKSRVLNYPNIQNKDAVLKQYAKQTLYRRTYKSMIPATLITAAIALTSALSISVAQGFSQRPATDYPGLLIATSTFGAASLTSVYLGIHFGIKAKKQKLKTLKVYNNEN